MAYQRSRRSFSRGGSSRFRSRFQRNKTHQPTRTGHWQRANMNLEALTLLTDGQDSISLTIIPIAQIFDRLASPVGATGQQIRFCEVGGVCFDWQTQLADIVQDSDSGLWLVQTQILLVSDRLDTEGNPAALDSNWFTNTTPIVSATSGGEAQDEDQRFPTRVHWRHSRNFNGGVADAPIGISGNGFYSTPVVSLQGSANLRLRLRLDDEHALAFHFTSKITDAAGVLQNAAFTHTVTGSLYYRTRY